MLGANKSPAFLALVGLAAQALASTPANAQSAASALDDVFRWTKTSEPGCAVGVARSGAPLANRAYGAADLERNVPISDRTVFDVGSVQKQFVAAAILTLVEEGRLSLADDVRKHVPELPDYGRAITVDHLLTHTSGLRDSIGLLRLAPPGQDALALVLRQRSLNFAPGEEWAYSNTGYLLLKEIVARRSGGSFADFLKQRFFEPLGMKSASYRDDLRFVVGDRALAYEKERGRWKMSMSLDEDRGGGALFATATDLLIWNEALASGRLGRFVTARLEEPARLNNGRRLNYARGLNVSEHRGTREVWHSGGADGYNAWLGRYPEHGLSIAFLCNTDVNGSALAHEIADRFLPETLEAANKVADLGAAPADLSGREGLYVSEAGEPLRIVAVGSAMRVAGGPPLVQVAPDRFRSPRGDLFFRSQDEFELRFLSSDLVELRTMEGEAARYRRAKPYAPDAAELQAFAGRYESGELGAIVQVAVAENGLTARLAHSPDTVLRLRPAYKDHFQFGRVTFKFERDGNGRISGLSYTDPLLRALEFERKGNSIS